MKFGFTFMLKQRELVGRFVLIEGGYMESREKMAEFCEDQWAFQYDEEMMMEIVEKYGLKEISLEKAGEIVQRDLKAIRLNKMRRELKSGKNI